LITNKDWEKKLESKFTSEFEHAMLLESNHNEMATRGEMLKARFAAKYERPGTAKTLNFSGKRARTGRSHQNNMPKRPKPNEFNTFPQFTI
jgi:hypothetical protein